MTDSFPTRGQLERTLSQRIQALYRKQLGHRVGQVDCQIIDQKIVIVLENAVTQPEQLLANEGKAELLEEVHANLKEAIQPQLKELIEAVLGVPVVDLLSDTTLETERTGMIAVLAEHPRIRDANGSASRNPPSPNKPPSDSRAAS
ncbi:DUF2294 domain-containing protein [Kovacikia minuta CCNUW1]|uniref:DUF2294 domain-containing protein n=1 Tax=Kovacikia minuta TaxID=2931930 RepID=UPI001CC9F813|nr:DUF2294 domain-containing protein [Kovacikia minuta]UBF24655.1 DUF2294 domain-containing protein [Kovacikia minuta CCNUW1]